MKLLKKFILLGIYNSQQIFCQEPRDQNQFLSATVSISAERFLSLEQVLNDVLPDLNQTELHISPIDKKYYHMTLIGFNLEISPQIKKTNYNDLFISIKKALNKASNDALKKNLDYIKKSDFENKFISLKFAYVGIFKKKIVAIFEMTKLLQILIEDIEIYFKNNINYLIDNCTISIMNKHQKILQPHVSIAKITNHNPYFGAGLLPKFKVKDFHISEPVTAISVQYRKK